MGCLTCLYAENTVSLPKCSVCGAQNPSSNNSEVMRECPTCHFVNSEFSDKCDMCSRSFTGPTFDTKSKRASDEKPERESDSNVGWQLDDESPTTRSQTLNRRKAR